MHRPYYEVEEVAPSPQFGTVGPEGWGFHLWSERFGDEAPHRAFLEKFAVAYPQSGVALPTYDRNEDFVECYAAWDATAVWVYYETILSQLWFWSADREAIEGVRSAVVPLAMA